MAASRQITGCRLFTQVTCPVRSIVQSSEMTARKLQKIPAGIVTIYPKLLSTMTLKNHQSKVVLLNVNKAAAGVTQSLISHGRPAIHAVHRCQVVGHVSKRALTSQRNKTQPCWNCGSEIDRIEEQHFCKCGVVQPPLPDRNHFEVMGVEENFDIDQKSLTQKFRDLQRKLHPDKFSMKSETEQEIAREQSSRVNQAYRKLQKPDSRALYMLELHGYPIEEGETQVDPVFLMDIMEINEHIVETDSSSELKRISQDAEAHINSLIKEVSDALRESDYSRTKAVISRLRYYVNIEEKAQTALETISND